MRVAWKLIQINLKAILRDPPVLFWSFAFPVLLLLALCLIWGRSATPELKIGLAGPSGAPIAGRIEKELLAAQFFRIFRGNEAQEMAALRKGDRHLVLVYPPAMAEHGGEPGVVRAYYDPRYETSAELALATARQAVSQVERQLVGRPVVLRMEAVPVRPRSAPRSSPAENFMPAVIALTIIQSGLGSAIAMAADRQRGRMDLFRIPPIATTHLVMGSVVTRVLIGGLQTLAIVVIGISVLEIVVRGSGGMLALLTVLGTLTFTAIGAALAMLARSMEAVNGLMTLISLPMIFLSGLFFPLDMMPEYMQAFALALPSSYLGDALRWSVTGVTSLAPLSVSLMILTAWAIGGCLFSVRFYRWQ